MYIYILVQPIDIFTPNTPHLQGYTYIHTYIYIEREIDRERDRENVCVSGGGVVSDRVIYTVSVYGILNTSLLILI